MNKINILNLKFSNVTINEAVDFAILKIKNRDKIYVVTPNAEIGYTAFKDHEFAAILNDASLVLPDGIGVVLASKILGKPLKQKVAGVVFAEELVSKMATEKMSLYILGGKPLVAKTACENLALKYDGLQIAGYQDGYYEDEKSVLDDIIKSDADVLFVCLGSPKQEKFIYENLNVLNTKIMCGIGGSADVFAGTVKRAPAFFVKFGLEWFYRLLMQPSRYKRMVKLPLYILAVLKSKFKKG